MLKLATLNVNGIRARQAQLQEWIARERPDIVCLQEIKATSDQLPAALCEMEGYWCYWHGGKGYSGVALNVSKALAAERPAFAHPSFDYENRIVSVDVSTAAGDLTVASVYVPNGGKDFDSKLKFLDALAAWSAEAHSSARALVICGDLNVAREDRDVHPKERKANQIGTRSDERALFNRLIDGGLVDVGRALDPANDNLFTWWPPWRNMRQRNIGWRIDYLLAGAPLAESALSSVSMREFGTSDHAPLVVKFGDAGS